MVKKVGGSGVKKVKKRMLAMKYKCGEYLSVTSEYCSIAGIVTEGKKIVKVWLFNGWQV